MVNAVMSTFIFYSTRCRSQEALETFLDAEDTLEPATGSYISLLTLLSCDLYMYSFSSVPSALIF